VLAFVNQVATIVHGNTYNWHGACNKNLGNSFLLIWRIGDMERLMDMSRSLWGSSPMSPGGPSSTNMLAKFDVRRIPGACVRNHTHTHVCVRVGVHLECLHSE
jgi:hypothetical protein